MLKVSVYKIYTSTYARTYVCKLENKINSCAASTKQRSKDKERGKLVPKAGNHSKILQIHKKDRTALFTG